MASERQRAWSNSGRPPAKHVAPKLTAEQRDEVRRRRAEGATLRALAVEFGVSVATIHRYS